ncbi:uncharacterized protein LOC112341282 [Selaginella moellendorffii]|uniref:uncharacterized protein LOC112341282 n=1 Tax=Selaginella moellendorffii TaxID=88036 RepID=UPI000D1C96A0|nr:uncharacterized protein LOC112341282 [Selaginella moellendorffii]|eukprot:XP_024516962.1 uncharacterized protein LOC112341282 [Selaginella moellendorffii]
MSPMSMCRLSSGAMQTRSRPKPPRRSTLLCSSFHALMPFKSSKSTMESSMSSTSTTGLYAPSSLSMHTKTPTLWPSLEFGATSWQSSPSCVHAWFALANSAATSAATSFQPRMKGEAF